MREYKIGDLVHEEHHPDRMGVIVDIIKIGGKHTAKLAVQWQKFNPNQWMRTGPEIIDSLYIVHVKEKS